MSLVSQPMSLEKNTVNSSHLPGRFRAQLPSSRIHDTITLHAMMTVLLLSICSVASPAAAFCVTPSNSLKTQSPTRLVGLQTDQIDHPDSGQPASKHRPSPKRKRPLRKPDVIYYPTPDETVIEMLRLADIKKGDVLYDLGSGDGRIPIMAAQRGSGGGMRSIRRWDGRRRAGAAGKC